MEAENRFFRESLNAEMDRMDDNAMRNEWIEERAAWSMKDGELYDPYSFQNFLEALENSPDITRKLMWEEFREAKLRGFQQDDVNRRAVYAVKTLVHAYWERIALREAREEYYRTLGS